MAPLGLTGPRDRLLDQMIERAREDSTCVAAALLGSAARGSVDEWSDIDLAIRLARDADVEDAARRWTTWISEQVEISDHLDIRASGALYRVFLCGNGLQVDLSFWPWETFRAVNGEPMRLLFGTSREPDRAEPQTWTEHARTAWLYALHARSAVLRGHALQADLMLASWRDRIGALAALRCGLDDRHAREAHLLPDDVQAGLRRARPSGLGHDELVRALGTTSQLYLAELRRHDPVYSERLRGAVAALAPSSPSVQQLPQSRGAHGASGPL